MNRNFSTLFSILIFGGLLASCGGGATTTPTHLPSPEITPTSTPKPTDTVPAPEKTSEPEGLEGIVLTGFGVNLDGPFAEVPTGSWEPATYTGLDYELPLDLDQITNRSVLDGLTDEQERFLLEHGFVVMHTQEDQFHRIRLRVSDAQGQPYFLTTDAAFHALHLTFDELLKALEREWLRGHMRTVLDAALDELRTYAPALRGTAVEGDYDQALAYLSVAGKLFDETFPVDPEVASIVDAQVAQVLAGAGVEPSALFPDFEDDYGAYKPVGHYAGDPELEAYFRGMTWFGRVNFILEDETSSRLPLLITMALRRAQIGETTAAQAWGEAHEVLSFLIGPSDDPGPLEYAELMDQVYGPSPDPIDLANESLWAQFVQHRDELPRPRINSLFVISLEDVADTVGWRFLGQRFTLDGFILQNLIFDKVEDKLNGDRRWLPTGPDVMAALGSEAALDVLEQAGESDYPGYLEQMAMLRDTVKAQTTEQWRARSYDAWLYTFLPVLMSKGEVYPTVMQTYPWALREMNTCLGSWAELKHDTILYSKMPEGAGGGGPPCTSGPPPSYVEANPEAFYRMAYVASVIAEGIDGRGLIADEGLDFCMTNSLIGLNQCMHELGDRFKALGDMAAKELSGEPLAVEDYALIQRCLGGHECDTVKLELFYDDVMEPLPIVAAVAGANIGVLEAATGYVDRIFVVVPIDGRFYAAQGGVYSYYEFVQPRDDRLTDEAWRERLDGVNAPDPLSWSREFVFEGGNPTDVAGYYIGAAYEVATQGIGAKLREQPDADAPTTIELMEHDLVQIVDGPVLVDGSFWWLFENCFSGERGWAPQEEGWFIFFSI
jgi:hypothetical protein